MLETGSFVVREAIPRGTDPDSGAALRQFTSSPQIHMNIYGEVAYMDAASRYAMFTRANRSYGPVEVWRLDLERQWITPVYEGVQSLSGMAVSPDHSLFCCIEIHDPGRFDILVWDIASLELRRVGVEAASPPRSLGSLGPDNRTYIYCTRRWPDHPVIMKVDLTTGTTEAIHDGPEIFNAHPQIDPADGQDILIQHNRGGTFDDEGNYLKLVGEQGATLYLIDRDGGNLRTLPVGKPDTAACQGHQSWLGHTGEILLTVSGNRQAMETDGCLLALRPGDEAARVVAKGCYYWHPNATKDGRFFVSDVSGTGEIMVGSLRTGRTRRLCWSGASCGAPQYTHPHPYFSPDAKWVLFNSDRTGMTQIWGAQVPAGLLEELEDEAGGSSG